MFNLKVSFKKKIQSIRLFEVDQFIFDMLRFTLCLIFFSKIIFYFFFLKSNLSLLLIWIFLQYCVHHYFSNMSSNTLNFLLIYSRNSLLVSFIEFNTFFVFFFSRTSLLKFFVFFLMSFQYITPFVGFLFWSILSHSSILLSFLHKIFKFTFFFIAYVIDFHFLIFFSNYLYIFLCISLFLLINSVSFSYFDISS